MSEITRVGIDLAKSVIQVHAVDGMGKLVTNRQLSRDKFLAWCAQLQWAALWPWRAAVVPTIGLANSLHWG